MQLKFTGFSGGLTAVFVAFILLLAGTTAHAATWYLSDEPDYWLYVDGDPEYELKLPSNAVSYFETTWAGSSLLQLSLGEQGSPMLIVAQVPSTDPGAIFQAVTGAFALSLQNPRTTQDQSITTERGLQPRFMVLEGTGEGGSNGLIRMVVFTKGDHSTYLLFVGRQGDYAGTAREQWLKAVHTFVWM